MTTAVHQKPAAPPSGRLVTQGKFPINLIDVKPQVRKKFDDNAHKELTESIRKVGDVISPITIRPIKERYELVAGERRLRALKAAGLTVISACVRELDDQAAALFQIEENIHRKDLTPIEEARGFKLLLDAKKFTVEQLAQLVDKSMPYVYRAVHLLDLPIKAVDAIESGVITPAHGHQLLRVPEKERDEFVKDLLEGGYDGHIQPATELREEIENQLGSDLAGAKFPKDKPYAGTTACTLCPHNSGNQGVLFDGAEKGTCTLKPCFDKKTAQHWADVVAKLESFGAHVLMSPNTLYPGQYIAGRTIGKEITHDQIKKGMTIALSKGSGQIHATTENKQAARRGAEPQHDYDRDNVISSAVQEAFFAAYTQKAKAHKFGKKELVELTMHSLQNWARLTSFVLKAWGWKKVDRAVLLKLTESQLIGLIYVCENHDDNDAKSLGINIAEDIKKVKEQAAKDYDTKKSPSAKKS